MYYIQYNFFCTELEQMASALMKLIRQNYRQNSLSRKRTLYENAYSLSAIESCNLGKQYRVNN